MDEIGEHPNALVVINNKGQWEPPTAANSNIRIGGGISGTYWLCNGQNIQPLGDRLPSGALPYKTFSMYYCAGFGFWVLRGDATTPTEESWRPLEFDHDTSDYSSYLTNAGTEQTLRCQRPSQRWPRMLLPDIYQVPPTPTHEAYGHLKGELPILLALIAFSMSKENLQQCIRRMFMGQVWQVHGFPHGRRLTLKLCRSHTKTYRCPSTRRCCLRLYMSSRVGPEFHT
jgi:hypothetical protein